MRSFSELTTSIENKPNLEEVQSYMEDKVSKNEFQSWLNSKASMEDVHHMIENKFNSVGGNLGSIGYNSLNDTKNKLDSNEMSKKFQSFTSEIHELLSSKANKEQVNGFLHKKANKTDVEISLKNKVDINEFQNVVELMSQMNKKLDLNSSSNAVDKLKYEFEEIKLKVEKDIR